MFLGMMVLRYAELISLIIATLVARNQFKRERIGNGSPFLGPTRLIARLHTEKVSFDACNTGTPIGEFQHDTIGHITGIDCDTTTVAIAQPNLVPRLTFRRVDASELIRVLGKV